MAGQRRLVLTAGPDRPQLDLLPPAAVVGLVLDAEQRVVPAVRRDRAGRPVEWVTSWYRGDRVTFVANLEAPRR